MEEPPLEEANHAARATDARNEPTMSTPSLKSFRDGVPRAASYSDSRNVYYDNTLQDEANRAANSSVREVSRQHTLQNEATPAVWRSDARKKYAHDPPVTPVVPASPSRLSEDMSSTVRGRRTTPTAKSTGRTILTADNVRRLDEMTSFAPRKRRQLPPESPATPSKALLASTREEFQFSASTLSATSPAIRPPEKPSDSHSNRTFSISDLIPPDAPSKMLPTPTSMPNMPNLAQDEATFPPLFDEREDDLARRVQDIRVNCEAYIQEMKDVM